MQWGTRSVLLEVQASVCVCVHLKTDNPHPYHSAREERPFLFPSTFTLQLEHPDNKSSLKDDFLKVCVCVFFGSYLVTITRRRVYRTGTNGMVHWRVVAGQTGLRPSASV